MAAGLKVEGEEPALPKAEVLLRRFLAELGLASVRVYDAK